MKIIALALILFLATQVQAQQTTPQQAPQTAADGTTLIVPGSNPLPGSNVPISIGAPVDDFNQPLDSDVQAAPSAATLDLPPSDSSLSSGRMTAADQKQKNKDTTLEDDIRQRMDNRDATFAKTVNVRARKGVVTLSGTVLKASYKTEIEQMVKAQSGIAKVVDEIQVIP